MKDIELELKFGVPAEALPSLRQALLDHAAAPLRLQARYFDTPDGRLAAHRVALRLRQEGDDWVQTLKAQADSAVSRLEHEAAAVAPGRGQVPLLVLDRHRGTEAHRVLMAALGRDGEARLVERLATDVQRLRCEVCNEETEIELALDLGEVRTGGRREPIAELEMEWLAGPREGLFELAAAWVLHGGLWLSTVSKAERGERLLSGARGPVHAQAPLLPGAPDGAALVGAVLRTALMQVIANAGDIAEGAEDVERVHQLRVGLRRLRTALHEFTGLSPGIDPAWETRLANTFARLGQARDASAVADAVEPLLRAAGAPLTRWSALPMGDVAAMVCQREFQATLVALLGLAHGAEERLSSATAAEARRYVQQRLERLLRQVRRGVRRFDRLPVEGQHRVRKRLKRVRYLAELVGPMWPTARVARFLDGLAPALEALGHHNDVAVAATAFRREADRHPGAWFAAGYLQAHLAVTAQAARHALAPLRDARRFWRDD